MKFYFTYFTFCLFISSFWAQSFNFLYISENVSYFTSADFNGDGFSDILYAEAGFNSPKNINILIHNQSPAVNFFRGTVKSQSLISGRFLPIDIDGDGDIDVIYPNGTNFDTEALINDGQGSFTTVPLNISGASYFLQADMDGDGEMDIVGINNETNKVFLYTRTANMVYSSQEIYSFSSLEDFTLGDINNDGKIDIVLCFSGFIGNQLVVLENNGNNNFTERIVVQNDIRASLCTLSDLNGDGLKDIVFASSFGHIYVAINKGSFNFEVENLVSLNNNFMTSILTEDVTGDGVDEILFSHTELGNRLIRNINKNDLSFDIEDIPGGFGMFEMLSADFNKDNAIDILGSNGDLWMLLNNIPQVPSSTKDWESSYKIYPIPATNSLTIEELAEGIYSATFYTISGEIASTISFDNTSLDISTLPVGLYIMEVKDSKGISVLSSKVIKQ